MKPLQEPWLSYGRRLRRTFDLSTELWTDVLDPDWHPEWPNGSRMTDNVAVENGPFLGPDHGLVDISGNTVIGKVEDAGFYRYQDMDLRTDDPRVLDKFPELNRVFPKMGLEKDEYRAWVPGRDRVGGLSDRGQGGDPWDEDPIAGAP